MAQKLRPDGFDEECTGVRGKVMNLIRGSASGKKDTHVELESGPDPSHDDDGDHDRDARV